MQEELVWQNGLARFTCQIFILCSYGKRADLQPFLYEAGKQGRPLKLLLHDAIFLATCLAVVLQDRLQVDCSVYHARLATYLATFLGLQRWHKVNWCYTVQFFSQRVSQCWKKIHCKLQKSCYTLQFRAATCNGFQNNACNRCRKRTKLYFLQSLQGQKSCEKSCKEGMLHATNLPGTSFAMPLQHKLQKYLDRVTLVVELGSTFCNDSMF